jgi:DNA-binding transcriptional LysR family regulator
VIRFGDLLDPSAGLRGGDADVAIVAGPFESAGLALRPLFAEPRGLAVSVHHPLAHKPAVTPAEFLDQPIVRVPSHDQTWQDYWYATSHRRGRPPVVGATAHSVEGMIEAIRAGLAVAVTIEPVVRGEAGITFLPIAGFEPAEFCVAWHARDQRAEVNDFVEAALSACAPDPAPST